MSDPNYYLRSPKLMVVSTRSALVFVREDGQARHISTPHVQQWSLLLQKLANPLPGPAVRQLLDDAEVADAHWNRLVEEGYIHSAKDADTLQAEMESAFSDNQGFDFRPGPPQCTHLIVACTGSIVAGLLAPTILSLLYSGFQETLDVILTESAQKFVTRGLFEAYGIRTWSDAFERTDAIHVPHVQLGRSADCLLVLPATANSLHRLAHATCTDLLSIVVSVTRAPVIVSPAMNEAMWNHPAVQRNLQQLREDGVYVIEPTLIFGAADVAYQGSAMFGGHGSLWGGPRALKATLTAVLALHRSATRGTDSGN